MHPNAKKRFDILQALYRARERMMSGGYISRKELESANGEVDFALGVLAEMGFVMQATGYWRITAHGVLWFEQQISSQPVGVAAGR